MKDKLENIREGDFFINLLRLKVNNTSEFQGSYERINNFYRQIMILLESSKSKDDKLFRRFETK